MSLIELLPAPNPLNLNEYADIGSVGKRFNVTQTKTLNVTEKLYIGGTLYNLEIAGGDYNAFTNKPSLSFSLTGHNHTLTSLSEKNYSSLADRPDLSLKADLVSGKIPSNQLPAYVDDVLEYGSVVSLPAVGLTGILYVVTSTNKFYRWNGTTYAAVNPLLELGTTDTTAIRGDYGKAAYDHSQIDHAPSNAQKNSDILQSEIENVLTGDINTHDHLASTHDNFDALNLISDDNGTLTYNSLPIKSGNNFAYTVDNNNDVHISVNVGYDVLSVEGFTILLNNDNFVSTVNSSAALRFELADYANFRTALDTNVDAVGSAFFNDSAAIAKILNPTTTSSRFTVWLNSNNIRTLLLNSLAYRETYTGFANFNIALMEFDSTLGDSFLGTESTRTNLVTVNGAYDPRSAGMFWQLTDWSTRFINLGSWSATSSATITNQTNSRFGVGYAKRYQLVRYFVRTWSYPSLNFSGITNTNYSFGAYSYASTSVPTAEIRLYVDSTIIRNDVSLELGHFLQATTFNLNIPHASYSDASHVVKLRLSSPYGTSNCWLQIQDITLTK